ncbi:hypothetical protein D915_001469 [Fasciola hepatica]|uniref:Uncharacterized protein n=1 Tax=Fasciola hepatica TaxID=6192 RepID=A0A4E0RPE6_FASHE|nr:hypothetical protein D915_001469 [Fasciola hepatica]
MDWSHYYETLETWVSEQYRSFESTRSNLLNMALERERFIQAQCLALSKYGAEMRKFQLCAPQSVPSTDARSSGRDNEQRPRNRCKSLITSKRTAISSQLFLISLIKNESSFTYFGLNVLSSAPEYRTFRRAKLWANSEFRRRGLPSSRFEKLLSLLQNGVEDEIEVYDLDLLFLIDHLGRFLSALVEAVFISYCFFGRGPGGATIGKWLMNLQVVSCDEVIPLPDMVEVSPGTHLGFARALERSNHHPYSSSTRMNPPRIKTNFSPFGRTTRLLTI